ncbi:MAG: hypothetical protein PWP65_53 [Clostridia bacterium]|nr:hypothetical protein [Clostridia bacterium]
MEYAYSWSGYSLGPNVLVAAGDVNGDGWPEIIAAAGGGRVYEFRWDGRIFRRRIIVLLGIPIRQLLVADTDGDGQGEIILGAGNNVFIYALQNYQYRLKAQAERLQGQVLSLAAGDVDGDGRAEIIAITVTGRTYLWRQENGLVLLWQGVLPPGLPAAGDVDGDGREEVVLLTPGAAGRVEVYAYAQGELTLQQRLEAGGLGRPLLVADFDGDGADEIVFVVEGGRRVRVLSGGLKEIWESPLQVGHIDALVAGDWDGDGLAELIIAGGREVRIYRRELGRFVLVAELDAPGEVLSIAVADVDRDGRVEIIVGTRSKAIHVLRQKFVFTSQFLVQETLTLPPGRPDILKVIEAEVTGVKIREKKVLPNKVIVAGEFEISVIYVAAPDRRVYEFGGEIPFLHLVHVPGFYPGVWYHVDVQVEYTNFHFNPARPREVEVVIIAEVAVFDYVARPNDTLKTIAQAHGVSEQALAEVNKLPPGAIIYSGQKLKLPPSPA